MYYPKGINGNKKQLMIGLHARTGEASDGMAKALSVFNKRTRVLRRQCPCKNATNNLNRNLERIPVMTSSTSEEYMAT